MFSRWKLALETSANFVATRSGNSRWSPAPESGAGFQREFPASVSWALCWALPRNCLRSLQCFQDTAEFGDRFLRENERKGRRGKGRQRGDGGERERKGTRADTFD